MVSINSSDRTCIFTFLLLLNGSLNLPFINICINLTQELRFDMQFIHHLTQLIIIMLLVCPILIIGFKSFKKAKKKKIGWHFLMTLPTLLSFMSR